MSENTIKITGEVFFASDMVKFNQFTEASGKYVAQLGQLSDKDVAALKEAGIPVGNNDTKGKHINCKSKHPQRAFDEDGNEIDPLTIGNGSKFQAVVRPYEWSFGKKKGISASLLKLVITDLKVYEPATTADDDDDIL